MRGRRFAFRVAAVAETFPGLDPGTREFVVLPRQSVPVAPIINRYLIAGASADPAALHRTGDDGQAEALAAELGRTLGPAGLPVPAIVVMAGEQRAVLGHGGANGLLTLVYSAGAAGGVLIALLAVAVTAVADTAACGRALSRLRTMGMSAGPGRTLLLIELSPPVVALPPLTAAVLVFALLLEERVNRALDLGTALRWGDVR
ncbi:hypothetical protein [Catenuloplanes indicus]|uniref:Uncharacterized protein n=1 Tax=Catenuloplanes indicus TaxID=137267 RepID=A0AAE3VXY8_9ACTN|nr:hypothetical protein [Catenuloplanes indicus]MDQ0365050.1 hypothetical protein [Catenuloplanes indicus]